MRSAVESQHHFATDLCDTPDMQNANWLLEQNFYFLFWLQVICVFSMHTIYEVVALLHDIIHCSFSFYCAHDLVQLNSHVTSITLWNSCILHLTYKYFLPKDCLMITITLYKCMHDRSLSYLHLFTELFHKEIILICLEKNIRELKRYVDGCIIYVFQYLIHHVDYNLCICILLPKLRLSTNSPLLLAKVPEKKKERNPFYFFWQLKRNPYEKSSLNKCT